MAKSSEAPADYYVYILYRLDKTPFYVGMGRGRRWLHHETSGLARESHKTKIVRQVLSSASEVPKRKIAERLTKDRAISLEKHLIKKIGRQPHGPLVNITEGGEGILGLTPEKIKERASGLKAWYQTEEGKEFARQRAARIAELWQDPVWRAAIIAKRRSTMADPERSKAVRSGLAAGIALQQSEKRREELREMMRLAWQDPVMRGKFITTGRKNTPETKARMSAAAKLRYSREKVHQ